MRSTANILLPTSLFNINLVQLLRLTARCNVTYKKTESAVSLPNVYELSQWRFRSFLKSGKTLLALCSISKLSSIKHQMNQGIAGYLHQNWRYVSL